MQSEISHAVNELIKSGKPSVVSIPGFNVIDVYPIVKHLFNQKAIATLENRTYSVLHQYNEFIGPKGFDRFDQVLTIMFKLNIKNHFFDWTKLYIRKIDKVNFFGSTCTKDTLPIAISKVIAAINDVADKDFTKASLLPLGILMFNGFPDEEEKRMAVLSYVSLTQAGENYVETNMPNMICREGEIPTKVEDQ